MAARYISAGSGSCCPSAWGARRIDISGPAGTEGVRRHAMYLSVFAWPESAVRVAGRRPALVTVRDAGTLWLPGPRRPGSQARRVVTGVNWRCVAWRYG